MPKSKKPPQGGPLGFVMSPAIKAISLSLNGMASLSQSLSAKLALKIFLTPPRHPQPGWEHELEQQGSSQQLQLRGRKIIMHEWGEGPPVLLVHSWGGRGTHLGRFVSPLVKAGYRVVAFDGPAHGRSSGKHTDMLEFASIIAAIADLLQTELKAVICHSFGAATTLLAARDFSLRSEKIITIGCFSSGIWVTETFGKALQLKDQIIVKMRSALEERYNGQLNWANLAPVNMVNTLSSELMIIHDEDDREVPFSHGVALQQAASRASFVSTTGLGHRRILKDEKLVHQVLQFIATQPASISLYSEASS